MSGRITLSSLIVLAVLIPGVCTAQNGYVYAPNGPPSTSSEPGQPPPQYSGSQPLPPGYQAVPVGYQGPQQAPNSIYEQIPDDLGFLYNDTPLEKLVENTFRHAYFRGEYLLWSINAPQPNLLGQTPLSGFLPNTFTQPYTNPVTTTSTVATAAVTSPAGTIDPNYQFYAQPIYPNTYAIPPITTTTGTPPVTTIVTSDPTQPTSSSLGVTAIAPSLAGFDIRNLNGFRGTMGMPIGPGAVEFSSFILATGTTTWDGSGYITPSVAASAANNNSIPTWSNYIGQAVTIDGTQHNLLYTNSYSAQLNSSLWGSEANYIFNAPNAGTGDLFTISPLVGLRYLNFRETLAQGGVYEYLANPSNPLSTALNSANRSFYSQSNNHAYGFQFGARAEMAVWKVVLGAEPKIMLGVNTYDAGLATSPLDLSATQTTSNVYNTAMNFQRTATMFSPVADLKFYSRINISKYMNVFLGYNIMWAGSFSRPYNNMGYNFSSTGAGLFNPTFSDLVVQGLSIGSEIRY